MAKQIEIPIIWLDEHILAIDKPAGLLSIPDGYDPSIPHVKALLSPQYEPLWIVHRLDRYTSGVMVLARRADAHRQLNSQFQDHLVKKKYLVLVRGNPAWDQIVVDRPLRVNVGHKHRTAVDPRRGKPSITRINVLERFGACSLVEATPQTGRRHQIRAHLAAEGYPVVCDGLYSFESDLNNSCASQQGDLLLERPGLHAISLEFNHPISDQRMILKAPIPHDFLRALDILRSHSS